MKKQMKNTLNHFLKIVNHKKWVFHYCKLVGIPFQGIVHDLSKFSPTEFIESVKYYQGTSSPIDACKKEKGYSDAWFHHKGRNKHHYEYWTDNYDKGGQTILMPYKYALEMLCDYLGAGRAYSADKFTYAGELKWWNEKKKVANMHPAIKSFISICLGYFALAEKYGDNIEEKIKTLDYKDLYERRVKFYGKDPYDFYRW